MNKKQAAELWDITYALGRVSRNNLTDLLNKVENLQTIFMQLIERLENLEKELDK